MGDPDRVRSARYLMHIRGKPCLVCGQPGSVHHITFAQSRAMGRKTGDQWTVPVCHSHHMDLHQSPMPERTWWALHGINPMMWAERAYKKWRKEHADAAGNAAANL